MSKQATFTDVGRRIFNVLFKATKTRKYYGSLKALFDDNEKEDIGISEHTLYRRDDDAWLAPYENRKVIIQRGELLTTGDIKKQ